MSTEYAQRFARFADQRLYRALDETTQGEIRAIGERHRLSFQQLRRLAEIAVDLRMWGAPPIAARWERLEREIGDGAGQNLDKKRLMRALEAHWQALRGEENVYADAPTTPLKSARRVVAEAAQSQVLGRCPVASEKTSCCNLYTLDAARGCGLGCSYCAVDTFEGADRIAVDARLGEKLRALRLDPARRYHIGSGQASDSLALGNRHGILAAQFEFARRNPNVLYELKTKSKNIAWLLKEPPPPNLFVSWSLNPPTVIAHEERLTASLEQRLEAARRVADRGIRVGFHLHPMIRHAGWREAYTALIDDLMTRFDPREAALVSFGTLTFTKKTIGAIRLRGEPTQTLRMPMEDAAGKFSYPMETKRALFGAAWEAFRPWRDRVFFYLCMEERALWDAVFGFHYADNDAFEQALLDAVGEKLSGGGVWRESNEAAAATAP